MQNGGKVKIIAYVGDRQLDKEKGRNRKKVRTVIERQGERKIERS